MRVLLLRPEPGASATADRLRQLDHQPVVSPVASVMPTGDPLPPGPFAAIVMTSRNALPAIAAARERLGGMPVFVVGARTADAVREASFRVAEFAPDAAGLADIIRQRLAPARLLHAGGRYRKPEPAGSLGRAGFDVTPWAVYDVRPASGLSDEAQLALRSGAVDAALHYSARSARLALALAEQADLRPDFARIRHYCLSPDIAQELAGFAAPIHVAEQPDEDNLLALLGSAVRARTPSVVDAMDGTNPMLRS